MKSFLPYCLIPAIVATITSCSRPKTAPTMPAPLVTVAQPRVMTITNWDEYPGHLEAVESVEIRPRVPGYIESIHFDDGAMVKAGDLLFVIDPRPFQAVLDRARAERQRAETRVQLTANELKRAESLRGSNAISEEEYDSRSKAALEAEAALNSAKAAEQTARLDVDYTRILAPISGRMGRRFVTVGNLVQGGGMVPGTVLSTLVTMEPIHCYFDADERVFLQYRKNGAASSDMSIKQGLLPCELALDGEAGFPHKGRIDFHDNRVNPDTGTLRLRGVFENSDGMLLPGGFARVRLPVERVESALLIPEVAIGSEQTRKFVFVMDAEQVVQPRPIQLGRQQGAFRAVQSGLNPEDKVVVSGLMMLRPGVKVQLLDTNAPTAAPVSQAKR